MRIGFYLDVSQSEYLYLKLLLPVVEVVRKNGGEVFFVLGGKADDKPSRVQLKLLEEGYIRENERTPGRVLRALIGLGTDKEHILTIDTEKLIKENGEKTTDKLITLKVAEFARDKKFDIIVSFAVDSIHAYGAAAILDLPHLWYFSGLNMSGLSNHQDKIFSAKLRTLLTSERNYAVYDYKLMEFEHFDDESQKSNPRKAKDPMKTQLLQRDNSRFVQIGVRSGIESFEKKSKPLLAAKQVDVIIPFYNDPLTLKLLESIDRHRSDVLGKVLIIDDQGPDRKIAKQVAKLADEFGFTYVENERNLGFVRTVNRGFRETKNDAIILNTDTIVTQGWVGKLAQIAVNYGKVATVTPLSSSAGYFSIPEPFISNPDDQPDLTNAVLEKLTPLHTIEVYSGHGFCMYITREALNGLGEFDYRTFKRGYGEENDFCLKARRHGYKNLLACNTYIHHVHGQSFKEEREFHKKGKYEILQQRYPELDGLIRDLLNRDPLKDLRVMMQSLRHDKRFVAKKVICAVNSINKRSFLMELLECFNSLGKIKNEYKLVLAGNIRDEDYLLLLKDYVKRHKLSEAVTIITELDDYTGLLRAADVMVTSDRYNAEFDPAVLAAAVMEKPVVFLQQSAKELSNPADYFKNQLQLIKDGKPNAASLALKQINNRDFPHQIYALIKEHHDNFKRMVASLKMSKGLPLKLLLSSFSYEIYSWKLKRRAKDSKLIVFLWKKYHRFKKRLWKIL